MQKWHKKSRLIVLSVVSFVFCCFSNISAAVVVAVKPDSVIGPVNRMVFGNSLIAYLDGDRGKFYREEGGGVWSSRDGKPEDAYLERMKQIGVSVLRWPGGNWRESMDWKQQLVGPMRQGFALPEYLSLCESVGAEPVITLSALHPEEIDIPALIAYLNQPVEVENAFSKWAALRSAEGRKEPWNVRWFEFGNENYNGELSVELYVKHYQEAFRQIKAIDPKANLGLVLEDSDNTESGWTGRVLEELGQIADFGVIHPYYPMVTDATLKKLKLDDVLNASLYADADFEWRLGQYQKAAKKFGRKAPLPLAATEYTAHFKQNEPLKIRHSLATALHNADFIRVMLQPRNHIVFANYWHLANGYWGILENSKRNDDLVLEQPGFLMFKLYADFLLDALVEVSMEDVPTQKLTGYVGVGPRGFPAQPEGATSEIVVPQVWTLRRGADVMQRIEGENLAVRFLGHQNVDYRHAQKLVDVRPNTLYQISVRIKSDALKDGKVGIAVEDSRGWSKNFAMTKNVNVTGTTDWTWVSTYFRTLSDTKKIKILARKFNKAGATTGEAVFGKTLVEEIPGVLPEAPTITSLASISESGDRLALFLINKSLESATPVDIRMPQSYAFREGRQLTGSSALAHFDKGTRVGKFRLQDLEEASSLVLPPHSMTALLFVK